MILDASGRPIRNVQPCIDEMLGEGVDYRVAPKNDVGGYGSYNRKFSKAVLTYAGGPHAVAVLESDEICVGEHVPGRFRPIIAAHEYGHRKGLTHTEIFRLELAMTGHLARKNKDPELKEDYLRWPSSDEMFDSVRDNIGHEAEQA